MDDLRTRKNTTRRRVIAAVVGVIILVIFSVLIFRNTGDSQTAKPPVDNQEFDTSLPAIGESFSISIDDSRFPNLDLEITVELFECKPVEDWIGAGQFTKVDLDEYAEQYDALKTKLGEQLIRDEPGLDLDDLVGEGDLYDLNNYHLGSLDGPWNRYSTGSAREAFEQAFGSDGSEEEAFIFRAAYFNNFLTYNQLKSGDRQLSGYVDHYAMCRMSLMIKNIGQDQHDSCGLPGLEIQLRDSADRIYDRHYYSAENALVSQNRPEIAVECDTSLPANTLLSGESLTSNENEWSWIIPINTAITTASIEYNDQIGQEINLR